MRIAVTRSGGFAGLVRRGEGDTADSPGLADLADRADVAGLPSRLTAATGRGGPPGNPDAFSYAISVDGADPVTVPEHLLDGPLRELVETVLASAAPPAAAPAGNDSSGPGRSGAAPVDGAPGDTGST